VKSSDCIVLISRLHTSKAYSKIGIGTFVVGTYIAVVSYVQNLTYNSINIVFHAGHTHF